MLTLLKNLECYSPAYLGKKDILICEDKIYKISPSIEYTDDFLIQNIYDLSGLLAFPGIIDQHVHILGGGGEEGFISRISEINFSDIISAGVTTVVGLLGADNATRGLRSLYAKAKALEKAGITTFIYSGSYSYPSVTLMRNIIDDLTFIDKVIGIKIAISDHRSSHLSMNELLKLSSDAHLGGMIGGKAGIVHLHVGDGKLGLSPLSELAVQSDLPIEMFVPTHVNRSETLFKAAIDYCKAGGNIDLTAGEAAGVTVSDAILRLAGEKTDLTKITVSSDSNGSIPGGGASKIQFLYEDITNCIIKQNLDIETVFRMVTENVAKILKLYPKKGTLKEGSDADILIADKNFNVNKLFGMGKLLVDNS